MIVDGIQWKYEGTLQATGIETAQISATGKGAV